MATEQLTPTERN